MSELISLMQWLQAIVEFQWLIEIVLLFICLYLPTKNETDRSNIVSLAVLIVIGGLGYRYGQLILQTDPDIKLTSLQLWLKTHKDVMLFAWYLGYCLMSNVAMLSIYLIHRKFNLPNSLLTRTVLLGFFAAAMLDLFRLAERYLWDTSYLELLYQWGMPSINIGALLVALTVVGKESYKYLIIKTNKTSKT